MRCGSNHSWTSGRAWSRLASINLSIASLASFVRDLSPAGAKPARMLVVLRDRRIDVLGGYLYRVERRFLEDRGQVREIEVPAP